MIMENIVLQRIKELISESGISVTKLAKEIGIPQNTLSRQIKGDTTMPLNTILSIIGYFKISADWLLGISNDKQMEIAIQLNKENNREKYIPHYEELSNKAVPHIDIISAECGLPSGFSSAIMKEQCEHYVIPDLDGCDFTIRAKGRSMINRTVPKRSINNRDIVGCKIVKGTLPIQWGEVYALATSDGVVIKKIQKSKENGCVSCVSYNTDDGYEPYDIPINEIYDWALVIGVVRIARWL